MEESQTEAVSTEPPQLQITDYLAFIAEFDQQIDQLIARAERTSVLNPFVILTLMPLSRQKREMTTRFEEAIRHAEAIPNAPLQTIGILLGGMMAQRASLSISNIIRVQNAWNELGAILDRKFAYSLAILSLYVSLISLAVSLISIIK